jgi:hypothetical protein
MYDGSRFFFRPCEGRIHSLGADNRFHFLNHAVPGLAAWAFAHPFRRLISAFLTAKFRFLFTHEPACSSAIQKCQPLKGLFKVYHFC